MSEWPVFCELRPDQPAIAICTRCGAFIGRESRFVTEGGLSECPRCFGAGGVTGGVAHAPGNPVTRFASTVRAVLLSPTDFVRRLDVGGRLAPAVWFGLVCIVLGQLAALGWLRLLMPDDYLGLIEARAVDLDVSQGQAELAIVTALPFAALVQLGLSGLMLHLGALLAGAKQLLRYRDYVRLFAYASAAYMLLLVPLDAGIILAFLFLLVICARALRVLHGLSPRQTFVATVPLALGMVFLHVGM